MSKTITTPYDTIDYLQTEEERVLYLEVCLEEAGDDPAFIAKALGNIARARNYHYSHRVMQEQTHHDLFISNGKMK